MGSLELGLSRVPIRADLIDPFYSESSLSEPELSRNQITYYTDMGTPIYTVPIHNVDIMIFLSLRFYVKSPMGILKVQNVPFYHI